MNHSEKEELMTEAHQRLRSLGASEAIRHAVGIRLREAYALGYEHGQERARRDAEGAA